MKKKQIPDLEKREKISKIMGQIDAEYVAEASSFEAVSSETQKNTDITDLTPDTSHASQRNPSTKSPHSGFHFFTNRKHLALAACILLVCIICGTALPSLLGNKPVKNGNTPLGNGELTRPYRAYTTTTEGSAIAWPWKYKSISEQFNYVTFNGAEYHVVSGWQNLLTDTSLLGEKIGTCESTVTDSPYDDVTEYHASFDVYRIKNIPEEYRIALLMDGEYYVYMNDEKTQTPPATLGELYDIYNLSKLLTWSRFGTYEKGKDTSYYLLNGSKEPSGTDHSASIHAMLSEARDAKFDAEADNNWYPHEHPHISFTITSESLGIYKHVVYISEDGYLWTNVFNYGYVYNIGTELANRIIAYAKENSIEIAPEPYEYALCGTVVEITDDYAFIDDSVLCTDPADGIVFKIPLDNIRIRRNFEFPTGTHIKVGSFVRITFQGEIDIENGYLVNKVTTINRARLYDDGTVIVPG